MKREHGNKSMTKKQLRQMLISRNAKLEKHIPDSARWQMAHRPYLRKESGTYKGKEENCGQDTL